MGQNFPCRWAAMAAAAANAACECMSNGNCLKMSLIFPDTLPAPHSVWPLRANSRALKIGKFHQGQYRVLGTAYRRPGGRNGHRVLQELGGSGPLAHFDAFAAAMASFSSLPARIASAMAAARPLLHEHCESLTRHSATFMPHPQAQSWLRSRRSSARVFTATSRRSPPPAGCPRSSSLFERVAARPPERSTRQI